MVEKTEDIRVIDLTQKPEIKQNVSYIRPEQSANVLFKFMSKLDYLKQILLNKAIMPRYYEEKIDYLYLDEIQKIAFPMSCFCDIHLTKLVPHMGNYGSYGIGLSKEWGIKQGIQPIHYINENSDLRHDFSEIFANVFKMSEEDREKNVHYNNYLLHQLFYMKPIDGQMITNEQYVTRNFHDEKEWRFIPSFEGINTELPLVIPQELMNPKSYNSYSMGISQQSELWLKFELNAIKHLIVSDQNDRKELIDFLIENQIGESDDERYILFSKILVFNEMREDW
ncbi:abortive infection system antitoxin AbiGi family protein [Gottfriedia acidiceleris]|uniref:abortive infection system antitoxin AbiGi family protein n=1 Tax=Gottfriedia acidiceleris TaxID=371036 RepID=UPI002F260763